ncbi:MAG: pyridoxal-5'-phosphate-dependent protein, partial [Pseudomonadota bacterium]
LDDDEVRAAMRFAFRHLKLVLEPGGALALAAVLRGVPERLKGACIGVTLSGGNVDPELFAETINDDPD